MVSVGTPGRFAVLACGLLSIVLLAGCSDSDSEGGANYMDISNNLFEGGDHTIAAGTTFEWHNEDDHQHSITIQKEGAASGSMEIDQTLAAGEHFTHKFNEAGTYHVWCKFHGGMGTGMHFTMTVT